MSCGVSHGFGWGVIKIIPIESSDPYASSGFQRALYFDLPIDEFDFEGVYGSCNARKTAPLNLHLGSRVKVFEDSGASIRI